MDSRLAEVYGLGALGLQLLIQDQDMVKPEPSVPFFRVFRPMDVHRQLMPFADREIRLPVRAVASEVAGTILDERSAAWLRLDPPGHDIVVSGRWSSFPIEEVVAVLRRLGHVEVEGHVGVGSFFHGNPRSTDLHTQLLGVEDVVFVDCEFAGVFAFLDDIGDDLNVSRCGILATSTGVGPLAEIAGFEVGFENDCGGGDDAGEGGGQEQGE